jgi:hypothetical protein
MSSGGGSPRRQLGAVVSLNVIEHDFAANGTSPSPIGPAERDRLLAIHLRLMRRQPARARLSAALAQEALKAG